MPMIPTAAFFGEIIDCRTLVFDARYYCLCKDAIIDLIERFYSFIETEFGVQCILNWTINRKALRGDIKDAISTSKIAGTGINLEFYGDVTSSIIYNKKTLKAYDKKLNQDPIFSLGLVPPFASVDYPSYAKASIDVSSPQALRSSLLNVFSLEGRVNKSLFYLHDIYGYLLCSKMIDEPTLYSGDIVIRISVCSADILLDELSGVMLKFGERLSLLFASINVMIGIRQSMTNSDYARYFGSLICRNINDPNALKMKENAKYLYLHDIGWANVVSPYVSQLITKGDNDDRCISYRLHNDALVIRFRDSISKITLADLKTIKKIVYPTVFPGESVFLLDWPYWRSYWQNTPILDEELLVTKNEVRTRYNGNINVEYLLSV